MPQFRSGRDVALSASPYFDALTSGPDESKYFAIIALRLHAATPEALRNHLVVGYCIEGEGIPPNTSFYNSGYCIADVLEGARIGVPKKSRNSEHSWVMALIDSHVFPQKAEADAYHVALAAVNGVEYLLTWNCAHIANAHTRPKIEATCRALGYEPPVICTPLELMED